MYSHYTPSLKKRALYDALDRYGGSSVVLDRYDGRGCIFDRYDGRGCIFDRYDGDHRQRDGAQCGRVVLDRYDGRGCIFDRYDGYCSVEYSFECYCCQHNGFRRNLCEEKTHERCQRKPVRQVYYSSD